MGQSESEYSKQVYRLKAEREACAPLLQPLLQLCEKWQQVLWLALEDFKESAFLLNPQLPKDAVAVDEAFRGTPIGHGPPLTTGQRVWLEDMLRAPSSRSSSRPSSAHGSRPSSACSNSSSSTAHGASLVPTPPDRPSEAGERRKSHQVRRQEVRTAAFI